MRLLVEYMGQLQSAVGRSVDRVNIAPGATLSALITQLGNSCGAQAQPHLLTETGRIQPSLLVAVNGRALTCGEAVSTTLKEGDIVVFLPPISGG